MSGFGRPVRRRFTWLELALAAGIAAIAVSGVAVLLAPKAKVNERDLAVRDAQRIRDAAVEWREVNPKGCPTLTQLKHERKLSSEARTDDPWGSRYRVSCTASGVVVVSAGRDGTPGTTDDVRVPKS